MIDMIINDKGELLIRQRHTKPSVYLDHWALMSFAEDGANREKFISTIKVKEGTLCLSWLSFMEFAKVSRRQQEEAERFIDAVLPNIICMNPIFFEVISAERENQPEIKNIVHIDVGLARIFLAGAVQLVPPFSVRSLLDYCRDPRLMSDCDKFVRSSVARIESLREEYRTNAVFRRQVTTYDPNKFKDSKTQQLFLGIAQPLIANPKLKLTRQHVFDLMHTVVPSSYCDFVLLDAHWATQVEQAKQRLRKAGVNNAIVNVYCGKKGGLGCFLVDLSLS